MKKKKIAILFQCTFEYRSTLLSGLVKKIKEKDYEVVAFSRKCHSQYLVDYFQSNDIEYLELDNSYFNAKRSYVESLNISSSKAFYRLKKINNFNYFNKDRTIKYSDYILGNYFINKYLKYITLLLNKINYRNRSIIDLFKKENITDFILCGYMSTNSVAFSINAQLCDVKVWLIMNNWKNVYVNNFLPFSPNAIFTWSRQMTEDYQSVNPQIRRNIFTSSGNPVFDSYYQFKPFREREFYERKYGFSGAEPLVLYTMLSPEAYSGELESIRLIKRAIDNLDSVNKSFILLRRNPLDQINLNKSKEATGVIYAQNYFDQVDGTPLMIQSEEGEKEWQDLLFHAAVVINVASTVTLEALMLDRPVINIEFDGNGDHSSVLRRYTDAMFYKQLKNHKHVHVCRNVDEFVVAFKDCLNKQEEAGIPGAVGIFDGKAKDRIIEEINS